MTASPLARTAATATDFWNDSCSTRELRYALEHGAVGATSNPTIVLEVLREERAVWAERMAVLMRENPSWGEVELAWQVTEELAVAGAELLRPVFERESGRKGRLSLQTNPQHYRHPEALVEQALRFDGLAPNLQVKIPATRAGIEAIEEATYRGVNVNATVSFTVPQALAVAEAVERGLSRRAAEGRATDGMTPVCTIMIGRLDDWLKVCARKEGILTDPGHLEWAGIAVLKRAYALYRERGYRTRLLGAAMRNHMHWSELVGGDVILTIPHAWQVLYNASDIPVRERFDRPVPPKIVDDLYRRFADFRRAYEPDGMAVAEFDGFGACVRTLRAFIASYHELLGLVRDHMLPDPDV